MPKCSVWLAGGLCLLLTVGVARDKHQKKKPSALPQVIQKGKPRSLRMARNWDALQGALSGDITPLDLDRGKYFKGQFDRQGFLSRVTYIDEDRQPVYEVRLQRDKSHYFRHYQIRIFRQTRLQELFPDLSLPPVSSLKKGWTIRVRLNSGLYPARIAVLDKQGIQYYFYEITYPKSSNRPDGSLVAVRGFRGDSTLVGSKELVYRSGEGLIQSTWRDARGRIVRKETLERDYTAMETTRTVSDSTGRILERRILPGIQ
ncbi:MAG: hypothetical protein D6762_04410 [Candidatus Neomarinimicrobiota bacterium]|nr:MAG: hypothetical protein D6762_04410 [Candidatus Neomarinimicrobiota bacterium]